MKPTTIGIGVAAATVGALAATDAVSSVPQTPMLPIPDLPGPDTNDPTIPPYEANLAAFLKLIRMGESSDNYRALVGGGEFTSFAGHPRDTMPEWRGVLNPRVNLYSTAAGGYQITYTTFNDLVRTHGFARDDFSPDAQDRMAIALLKRRGAFEDVRAGRVSDAHWKLVHEWEMFQMPRWSVANTQSTFNSLGGVLV